MTFKKVEREYYIQRNPFVIGISIGVKLNLHKRLMVTSIGHMG